MHGTSSQGKIQAIAKRELKRANDDVQQATIAMVRVIERNDALYRLLMNPLLRTACYDEVCAACRRDRHTVWVSPQPTQAEVQAANEALAEATLGLYAFALPGGKRLGDATKSEVVEAATFYLKQSADMRAKGLWLGMIAKQMRRNVTVKRAVPLAKLADLKEKAKEKAKTI